jgi:hypothetical protein
MAALCIVNAPRGWQAAEAVVHSMECFFSKTSYERC